MLNKVVLIFLFFVGLIIFPLSSAAETTLALNHTNTQQIGTKTVTLSVSSMTCPVCPITVKKSLESIDGVNKVLINFKAKTATVTFNPQQVNVPDLTEATKKAGYPSQLKP